MEEVATSAASIDVTTGMGYGAAAGRHTRRGDVVEQGREAHDGDDDGRAGGLRDRG
jgi:hypothetical protein